MTEVAKKVRVANKLGFHIRPSRHFSALARSWDAEVTVRNEDRSALVDSQLDLLMLCAVQGSELEIIAKGPQAEEAVDSLVRLVEDMFGEGE